MIDHNGLLDNQTVNTDFIDQLNKKELEILRNVVKKIHMKHYPENLFTTDMADMLICKFGYEYGEKVIKAAVDAGNFN
jgi:uncharacterized protein YdhG (YjbR/CyaY superfamily)